MANRKDSQWIYSSQSQQMVHGREGSITLSALPPHRMDTTLRLHKAIQNAHILLAASPDMISAFLEDLELSTQEREEGLTVVKQ
jgi:hypothetical protein